MQAASLKFKKETIFLPKIDTAMFCIYPIYLPQPPATGSLTTSNIQQLPAKQANSKIGG